MAKKRVLVVGLGNMGISHALAYTRIPDYEVVGVCTRHIADKQLPEALAAATRYADYDTALAELKPDVVSVNTLPDTSSKSRSPRTSIARSGSSTRPSGPARNW